MSKKLEELVAELSPIIREIKNPLPPKKRDKEERTAVFAVQVEGDFVENHSSYKDTVSTHPPINGKKRRIDRNAEECESDWSQDHEDDASYELDEFEKGPTPKQKKKKLKPGVKGVKRNKEFDALILNATMLVKLITTSNTGQYQRCKLDAAGRKTKELEKKILIFPPEHLTLQEKYDYGLQIKQYIIKICNFKNISQQNIIVKPAAEIELVEFNRNQNQYRINDRVVAKITIANNCPAGTVAIRGKTIAKVKKEFEKVDLAVSDSPPKAELPAINDNFSEQDSAEALSSYSTSSKSLLDQHDQQSGSSTGTTLSKRFKLKCAGSIIALVSQGSSGFFAPKTPSPTLCYQVKSSEHTPEFNYSPTPEIIKDKTELTALRRAQAELADQEQLSNEYEEKLRSIQVKLMGEDKARLLAIKRIADELDKKAKQLKIDNEVKRKTVDIAEKMVEDFELKSHLTSKR